MFPVLGNTSSTFTIPFRFLHQLLITMKQYYIQLADSPRLGPFDEQYVREQYAAGTYQNDTFVWTEGMTDWGPIATEFPDIAKSLPPPPPCSKHARAHVNLKQNEFSNPYSAFLYACRNVLNYKGRSSRKEYWMGLLGVTIAYLICYVFGALLCLVPVFALFSLVLLLSSNIFIFMLSFSMTCRRLHDIGRSGWEQIITYIPIAGWIIWIVWCCTAGERGTNKYGPDPQE